VLHSEHSEWKKRVTIIDQLFFRKFRVFEHFFVDHSKISYFWSTQCKKGFNGKNAGKFWVLNFSPWLL